MPSPSPSPSPLVLAYYCSGHGYGHATRVSAFTRHLLLHHNRPASVPTVIVHIVSSAPALVFQDSIACGAKYRYAEIDPVIVQPLAYRVDRQKSLQVLQHFLSKKDVLVAQESAWLCSINAHAVLTDAAFLACLAAHSAGIPSILITNFTFDSVYSFLSTPLLDLPPPPTPSTIHHIPSLHHLSASQPPSPLRASSHPHSSASHPHYPSQEEADTPLPLNILHPLTLQLLEGYTHASLLVLLPGAIPIPSFSFPCPIPSSSLLHVGSPPPVDHDAHDGTADIPMPIRAPKLPASDWVDVDTRRMNKEVEEWMRGVASMRGKGGGVVEHCNLDVEDEEGEDEDGSNPLKPKPLSSTVTTTVSTTPKRLHEKRQKQRQIIHAPLIVRPPSGSALNFSSTQSESLTESPYTPTGRSTLLSTLGVPPHLHDWERTKVLVVSFGGQVFRCPSGSRSGSRSTSRQGNRTHSASTSQTHSRRTSRDLDEVVVRAGVRVDEHGGKKEGGVIQRPTTKAKTTPMTKDVLKPLDPNSISVGANGTVTAAIQDHLDAPGLGLGSRTGLGTGMMIDAHSHSHLVPVNGIMTSSSLSPFASVSASISAPALVNGNGHALVNGHIHNSTATATALQVLAPGRALAPGQVHTKNAYAFDLHIPSFSASSSSPSPSSSKSPSPSLLSSLTSLTSTKTLTPPTPMSNPPTPPQRLATPCHIWIPGAPAAALKVNVNASANAGESSNGSATKGSVSNVQNYETEEEKEDGKVEMVNGFKDNDEMRTRTMSIPSVFTIPPTPAPQLVCEGGGSSGYGFGYGYGFEHERERNGSAHELNNDSHSDEEPEDFEKYSENPGLGTLLPDESWIAIVCGVSSRNTRGNEKEDAEEEEDELPEGFYIAPRDVYMPDLMAVADVLLSKLGYGTVSECVDACTPFVYVSRPLFIEEHGLRLLLDQEGVGVELSREAYERGEWAGAVQEAYGRGKEAKEAKRRDMGVDLTEGAVSGGEKGGKRRDKRQEEGRELAGRVVSWVREWWDKEADGGGLNAI